MIEAEYRSDKHGYGIITASVGLVFSPQLSHFIDLVFINARTWMKSLHGRWFNLNEQTFDAIHYAAMAVYKILIMVFNLVPFIILSFLD